MSCFAIAHNYENRTCVVPVSLFPAENRSGAGFPGELGSPSTEMAAPSKPEGKAAVTIKPLVFVTYCPLAKAMPGWSRVINFKAIAGKPDAIVKPVGGGWELISTCPANVDVREMKSNKWVKTIMNYGEAKANHLPGVTRKGPNIVATA